MSNPKVSDTMLDTILDFDPIDSLERAGVYDSESFLGLHIAHGQVKREALQARGDTHFNSNFADSIAIAESEGFKIIVDQPFIGRSHYRPSDPDKHERYIVMWHDDGFLLTLESYNGTGRNNSKLYYNLNLDGADWKAYHGLTSSGGFYFPESERGNEDYKPTVWAGDHDAREGFRYIFKKLQERGSPLKVWKDQPHLWFCNYMDLKDENGEDLKNWLGSGITDTIKAAMIARFPQYVQDAIRGE